MYARTCHNISFHTYGALLYHTLLVHTTRRCKKNFVEALNFLLKLSFCFTINSLLVPQVRTRYIRRRRFLRTSETQCSYLCFSKAIKNMMLLLTFVSFIFRMIYIVPGGNQNVVRFHLDLYWSTHKIDTIHFSLEWISITLLVQYFMCYRYSDEQKITPF